MQEHAKSKWHNEACLLAAEYERSQKEGTIADRMQSASNDQRAENRKDFFFKVAMYTLFS